MARTLRVQAGTLLAAWPDMLDPNFMHTVIVVCQHTEEGAYGLVTNRRTEFVVGDLVPDHPDLGSSGFPVHLGGPVDHGTMQFLHTVPESITGGVEIDAGLWLGGDLDELGGYLEARGAAAESSVRVLLGYSGWGAGQLEGELGAGSWLWAPPDPSLIFGPEGESTWRKVVRASGGGGEDLSHRPPDISWN